MARPAPSPTSADSLKGGPRSPPAIAAIAPGMVIADKYLIKEPLRRGGMGTVWIATHLQLDTPVALKFMLNLAGTQAAPVPAVAPGAVAPSTCVITRERFDREAKAAAQIRSANVVQILDYGVDRERDAPYIAMELLSGEDLGARLKRLKRLPLDEVTGLVVAVSRALQRAHDVGLVHRDLKPANVFLARDGDEIVPKVLDFGVAKVVNELPVGDSTVEGMLVGTPSYMSPEQAMGRSTVDHRADLWSLGVIIYRALTGIRPFQSDSFVELVVKICSYSFVPPTQLVPELPPAIDAFIERALDRDPAKRFQSAREMGRALLAISELPSPSAATRERGGPLVNLGDDLRMRVELTESYRDLLSVSGSPASGSGMIASGISSGSFRSEPPGQRWSEPPASGKPPSSTTNPSVSSYNSYSSFSQGPSAPGLVVPPSAPRPSRAGLVAGLLGFGVALALVGTLLIVSARHGREAAASRHDGRTATVLTASIASTPPTPAATPNATQTATPEPPTPADATATTTTAAPSAAASSSAKPHAARPPVTAKHADCSAPFFWDKNGTKFIKPECL